MRSSEKTQGQSIPNSWAAVAKGVLAAVLASLVGIVLFAFALKLLPISDSALPLINQMIKALSVILGAYLAVGRGGQKGFVKGAAVGLLYSALGLVTYWVAGRAAGAGIGPWPILAGDVAMAMAIGAIAGMLAANLKPNKQRK